MNEAAVAEEHTLRDIMHGHSATTARKEAGTGGENTPVHQQPGTVIKPDRTPESKRGALVERAAYEDEGLRALWCRIEVECTTLVVGARASLKAASSEAVRCGGVELLTVGEF